jgi:hypothetical protein
MGTFRFDCLFFVSFDEDTGAHITSYSWCTYMGEALEEGFHQLGWEDGLRFRFGGMGTGWAVLSCLWTGPGWTVVFLWFFLSIWFGRAGLQWAAFGL